MVTPLGCGVETTWKCLIEGKCGIRAVTPEDLKMNAFDKETQMLTFDQLTSKVAAIVPCGTNPGKFNEELWLNSKVILFFLVILVDDPLIVLCCLLHCLIAMWYFELGRGFGLWLEVVKE